MPGRDVLLGVPIIGGVAPPPYQSSGMDTHCDRTSREIDRMHGDCDKMSDETSKIDCECLKIVCES
jgi:hypothetical protein